MKKIFAKTAAVIFLASCAFLASCYSDGEDPSDYYSYNNNYSSSSKSSSSNAPAKQITFTIKNESGFDLADVRWNGTEFGDIKKSGVSEKTASAGNGKISFTIVSKNMDVETYNVVQVEDDFDNFTITQNTLVKELSGLSFTNMRSISQITKTINPLIIGCWLDEDSVGKIIDSDEICFREEGDGENDWYYFGAQYEGYKFRFLATETELELTVTGVYWTEGDIEGKKVTLIESEDLADLSELEQVVPPNSKLSYEVSEDGKSLNIPSWNRTYTKQ